MAFLNRVGNVLKQTVSKNVAGSSLFRSMSTSSKLFVRGLSYSTDELSLKEAFSQYGEVIEARVINLDRETSSEAASSAILALDSQDLHGRQIRLNFATERPRTGGYGGSGGGGYQGGGGGYNPASQQPPPQSGGNSNYASGGGGGTGADPFGGFASPLADFDPTKGDFPSGPHVDTTSGLGEIPSGPRPLADGKSDDYNDILVDKMVDESDNYNDILLNKVVAEIDKSNARFMDKMVDESDDYDDMLWDKIEGDVWTTLMITNLPPENEASSTDPPREVPSFSNDKRSRRRKFQELPAAAKGPSILNQVFSLTFYEAYRLIRDLYIGHLYVVQGAKLT